LGQSRCSRQQLGKHHGEHVREVLPGGGIADVAAFGTDPNTSPLDVNCKAHDLDNLYVVDTSFFPSSSAVNPALTAMANALRVGDHLLERLGASTTTTREEVPA
jgi:hypothetical protein